MPGEPKPGVPERSLEIQYHDAAYRDQTAISGMWLFLASELLFFGGLLLAWIFCRHQHPAAFAAAAERTEFGIGTVNTIVLLTSSFVFASAVALVRGNEWRRALWAGALTALLGAGFVGLKAIEWSRDIAAHDVPGAGFHAASADAGGEQLFWLLYWTLTIVHVVHLLVGIGLVGWVGVRVWRRRAALPVRNAAEVVGLYWSFVDMIWLVLYPLIYLAARR